MKIGKQRGFTLVEVIVVAGIIAILAGILVPLILKEIDEARITRAYADVRSISTAVIVMRKDTGKWPNLDNSCNATATLIQSDGILPTNTVAMGFDSATPVMYNAYLASDESGCYGSKWKGPYMAWVNPDPWGNAYITNIGAAAGTGPLWILSAGPDGIVNTQATNNTVAGDDVAIRLK